MLLMIIYRGDWCYGVYKGIVGVDRDEGDWSKEGVEGVVGVDIEMKMIEAMKGLRVIWRS